MLWAQIQKMQIPALLEQYIPTHGLWKGALSFGEVAGVWLMFITSQGDHCLSHVQPWFAERLDTLTACVGKPIRPLDFSDDRLADLLDRWAETAYSPTYRCLLYVTNAISLAVGDQVADSIRQGLQ